MNRLIQFAIPLRLASIVLAILLIFLVACSTTSNDTNSAVGEEPAAENPLSDITVVEVCDASDLTSALTDANPALVNDLIAEDAWDDVTGVIVSLIDGEFSDFCSVANDPVYATLIEDASVAETIDSLSTIVDTCQPDADSDEGSALLESLCGSLLPLVEPIDFDLLTEVNAAVLATATASSVAEAVMLLQPLLPSEEVLCASYRDLAGTLSVDCSG